MGKKSQKPKIVLPPELPPDVPEEEIEVSDEDLQFLQENRDYAHGFSRLDTHSITKHVTRVADVKEDALEALYEKRLKKKTLLNEKEESGLRVDPVDALPVKTLDGKLYYRTLPKSSTISENVEEDDDKDGGADKGIVKVTKAERRAKLKKQKRESKKQGKELDEAEEVQQTPQAAVLKRESKKQGKELDEAEEVQQTPQAAVLAEVKQDLTAEEAFKSKMQKLAELGMALLADPESNIKSLKEMLQISKDNDNAIVKLGVQSLLVVFKDIIPGYRIRLPTEKELEMKVSKTVKKTRYYESTLLSAYKAYLQKLIALEKKPSLHKVFVRCICTLLDAVPHFNFRESLLGVVVRNLGSSDDVVRKHCYATIKSLFTNEGKHGGEATVEAVRLIADHVKANNCQLHPDFVEVFLSLSFDDDLGRPEKPNEDNNRVKNKKNRKRKNLEEPSQLPESDKKKSRKQMMTKMREEVAADYKTVSFTPDVMDRRRMQSETLSAVFETYFRILKHSIQPTVASHGENGSPVSGESGSHPLLAPCLKGLGKFSHLIDLDFMGDLMNYLKKLASGGSNPGNSQKNFNCFTISERLQCCIVAFKVMKSNLDALNVDLQDFFVQLYNLILDYRPGRDLGGVLAEALKTMLFEDRQHDMLKAAAFVKRLATFSLCFGSAEAMAALVTSKHLLQKNVKCRNLLENDAGGGSVSGTIAKFQPYASDPNLSGALASVLWELDLLSKHYHPAVSTLASSISSMTSANNQVFLPTVSPQQAFLDLSLERESFTPQSHSMKLNNKRKRGSESSTSAITDPAPNTDPIDEDKVRKKLSTHFMLLRDIKENERLRAELDRTTSYLQLYEEHKQQKKKSRKKTIKG